MLADTNECDLAENNCTELCMNTPGSFYCDCDYGSALNDDGYSCTGIEYIAMDWIHRSSRNICLESLITYLFFSYCNLSTWRRAQFR